MWREEIGAVMAVSNNQEVLVVSLVGVQPVVNP